MAALAACLPFFKKGPTTIHGFDPLPHKNPFLPLQGNAFDTCPDGDPHYNQSSFEEMSADIERFRMPHKWTEARMLNISSPEIS